MSYAMDQDYYRGMSAADSEASVRTAFIRRTYAHVAAAIVAFVGIEAALFSSGFAEQFVQQLFSTGYGMLILIGGFIVGGIVAQRMANSTTSTFLQYMGLSAYVMLECVIFLPLLYVAEAKFPGQYVAAQAGIITLAAFAGLTTAVMVSGKDFSFLGPILWALSFVAFGLILVSLLFNTGLSLGTWFSAAMVMLAAGFIVYDTSNVMHRYRPTQHVAAALALFASVALMFWYVLRLFMGSSSD